MDGLIYSHGRAIAAGYRRPKLAKKIGYWAVVLTVDAAAFLVAAAVFYIIGGTVLDKVGGPLARILLVY
jgi:hypothetical protein